MILHTISLPQLGDRVHVVRRHVGSPLEGWTGSLRGVYKKKNRVHWKRGRTYWVGGHEAAPAHPHLHPPPSGLLLLTHTSDTSPSGCRSLTVATKHHRHCHTQPLCHSLSSTRHPEVHTSTNHQISRKWLLSRSPWWYRMVSSTPVVLF